MPTPSVFSVIARLGDKHERYGIVVDAKPKQSNHLQAKEIPIAIGTKPIGMTLEDKVGKDRLLCLISDK